MKRKKSINNIFYSIVLILLTIFLMLPLYSCEKKLEVSDSDNNEFIIVRKDHPIIKKKEPKYSTSSNVPSSDLREYSKEKIEEMALELKMKGFNEGNRRYFKNEKHMIFNSDQIPTIYKHKDEYFEELEQLW